MMLLTQSEVGVGREGRVRGFAGQQAKQGSNSLADAPNIITMDDGKISASLGPADCATNGTKPIAVTFWMPDGSCDEGKTRHVGGEVMFIESKRMVPVGAAVTVRLAQPNDVSADWGGGRRRDCRLDLPFG